MTGDIESNNREEDSEEENSDSLTIVRAKNRTIHVSPTNRKKEEDYVIGNFTDQDMPYVYLPLPEFKRNLTVHDEEGFLLSVFPKRYVSEAVNELKESKSEQSDVVPKDTENTILIQLPPESPLKSGYLRTIRLEFEQSDQVKKRNISNIFSGLKYAFFDIPYFAADVQREPAEEHDVFIIIVGAPGYKLLGESEQNGESVEEVTGHAIYENGIDDNTRNISIRLPAPEKEEYSYRMEYELIPSNRNLLITLELYWLIMVVAGLLSLWFAVQGAPEIISSPSWMQDFSGLQTIFSASVISGTLGIMFALKKDWAERYRLWCIGLLVIHTLAWIVWTNSGVTFP